jgi:hypothetical protein
MSRLGELGKLLSPPSLTTSGILLVDWVEMGGNADHVIEYPAPEARLAASASAPAASLFHDALAYPMIHPFNSRESVASYLSPTHVNNPKTLLIMAKCDIRLACIERNSQGWC